MCKHRDDTHTPHETFLSALEETLTKPGATDREIVRNVHALVAAEQSALRQG